MTAREESFLVLEQSLTNRLTRQWERQINSTLTKIVRAVNEQRWQDAEALCEDLSMARVAERNQRYMQFVGMQAVLFGASRLTQGRVDRTMFTQEGATVPDEVDVAAQALTDGLSVEGSEDVCRWAQRLIAEERAAQDAAAFGDEEPKRMLKAATDTFIRRFGSSVRGNGEAYINITSSLHTSRLGGWGFLQEAKFRGITQYQVSEQLDSRICPVCQAMHGRVFDVGPADAKLNNWLSVSNLQEFKSIAPWPSQSKSSVKALKQMTSSDIATKGWDTPPYHPRCRGILVEIGAIPIKQPEVPAPDARNIELLNSRIPVEELAEQLDEVLGGTTAAYPIGTPEYERALAARKKLFNTPRKEHTREFLEDIAESAGLTANGGMRIEGVRRVESYMVGDVDNVNDAAVFMFRDIKADGRGTFAKFTREETEAASFYVGSGYRNLNALLRGIAAETEVAKGTKVMRTHMGTGQRKWGVMEQDTLVFRAGELPIPDDPRDLLGAVVKDSAYMSTSISRRFAESWSNRNDPARAVIYDITIKRGQKALPMVNNSGEMEVLLAKGTSMRITAVDNIDEFIERRGPLHLKVELDD